MPPTANGLRALAESAGVNLPTTTARGSEGALVGGVVDVPIGVRAQSSRYRLVNTGLTPGGDPMGSRGRTARWVGVAGLVASLLAAPAARAEPPEGLVIHFQGDLTDLEDKPVTDVVDVEVRIYASPSGGAPISSEQHAGSGGVCALYQSRISCLMIPR